MNIYSGGLEKGGFLEIGYPLEVLLGNDVAELLGYQADLLDVDVVRFVLVEVVEDCFDGFLAFFVHFFVNFIEEFEFLFIFFREFYLFIFINLFI